MKRFLLKAIPLLASAGLGALCYWASLGVTVPASDLMIGLSASFLAIPLIFLGYQSIANFSSKRLKKEILDFFKLQIDTSILSIVNKLSKYVYAYDRKEFNSEGIGKFLDLTENDLRNLIINQKYLGFQLFKQWDEEEGSLTSILKNFNAFTVLEERAVICLIGVLKAVRSFSQQVLDKDAYEPEALAGGNFKIVSGISLNPTENKAYPNRLLLLRSISKYEYRVYDFGDFRGISENDLLKYFRVRKEILDSFAKAVHSLSQMIKEWIRLNKNEIIVDEKAFRTIKRK